MLLTDEQGGGRPGDLGRATTSGTGSGVILTNVTEQTRSRCEHAGRALARAYKKIPDDSHGRPAFTVRD